MQGLDALAAPLGAEIGETQAGKSQERAKQCGCVTCEACAPALRSGPSALLSRIVEL